MTINVILFLTMLTSFGVCAKINTNKGTPLAVDKSWKNVRFFSSAISLEDESGDFLVLRKRRETSEPGSEEFASGGSGDDECTTVPSTCGDTSNCARINDTFQCICKSGYSGNGTTCDDINECNVQVGSLCHVDANCTNTNGSYSCACKNGFYGDGFLCKEILRKYSTETVYARQGDSAILVCTFNDTISWTRAGNRFNESASRQIYDNVLVIQTNGEDDFGEYVCHVTRYNHVSIKMNLIKYKERENESNDTKYIVPLILISMLLVGALIFIVYLICTRQSRVQEPRNKDTNDYVIPNIHTISRDPSPDPNYASLGDRQVEENTYEQLNDIHKNDDVDKKETAESLYEMVDYDLKHKV